VKTLLIILSYSLIPGIGYAQTSRFEVTPSKVEEHCEAFHGQWNENTKKCVDRLEYQQEPISNDAKQWCETRGGSFVKTRRVVRCRGTDSKQGLKRFPSFQVRKYKVHEDVKRSCLRTKKILNAKCTVSATDDMSIGYDFTNKSNHAGTILQQIVSESIRKYNQINYNYKGEMERKLLVSTLRNFVSTNNLNSCQKACLLKCAASNVLKYSLGNETKFGGIADIYDKRVGECTEYSSIAKHLGKELDIPIFGMIGPGHAYNYFKIDGSWYYGEPQEDDCEFFHTKSTLSKYQRVFSKEEDEYDGSRTLIEKLPSNRRGAKLQSKKTSGVINN
tara:strand:+ start:206930 stop:207925 length:996 start_codon:yes stop_codon:yes gene_type:complete